MLSKKPENIVDYSKSKHMKRDSLGNGGSKMQCGVDQKRNLVWALLGGSFDRFFASNVKYLLQFCLTYEKI